LSGVALYPARRYRSLEICMDGRASIRLNWTVSSVLEWGQLVVLGWYHLHYHPPLELVGGSALLISDLFI
jgi:hypothetical protein